MTTENMLLCNEVEEKIRYNLSVIVSMPGKVPNLIIVREFAVCDIIPSVIRYSFYLWELGSDSTTMLGSPQVHSWLLWTCVKMIAVRSVCTAIILCMLTPRPSRILNHSAAGQRRFDNILRRYSLGKGCKKRGWHHYYSLINNLSMSRPPLSLTWFGLTR